jgi:hypothetical protein
MFASLAAACKTACTVGLGTWLHACGMHTTTHGDTVCRFDLHIKRLHHVEHQPLTCICFLLLLSAVAACHLQSDAAPDSLPFRRLLSRDHASDREAEDRSAAVTNPLLLSAYKRLEVSRRRDGTATTASAAGSSVSQHFCRGACSLCANAHNRCLSGAHQLPKLKPFLLSCLAVQQMKASYFTGIGWPTPSCFTNS